MDCVVFFDDVLVPWERVFMLGDVELLNGTATARHSSAHTAHQGAAKNLAKCEFVLGVALLMTETLGNAHLPTCRGAHRRVDAEHRTDAGLHARRRGGREARRMGRDVPRRRCRSRATRNLFMTAYPRMVEILQLLGSSQLHADPERGGLQGAAGRAIEQYLATDSTPARDRVKLFHLAWDIACSSFGSRQVLYERFFASDPLTRARAMASIYPKKEVTDRVLEFLGRDNDTL